ncbi:hypothetical protein EK546_09615 [Salmonella enterica]|nr:hypothetical protein [Salmonella enterica]
MMDKLIRDLLINVKQQGATKTTKAIQGIVDALEDAAVGAELANEQLAKISPTLATIEKNARKTAASMADLGTTKNLDRISRSLSTIEDYLDELLTTSTVASEKMAAGFKEVSQAVNRMGNTIAGTVERTEDQLIGLNSTVNKTNRGFGETTNSATKVTRAIGDTSGAARGATRDFAAMAKIGGTLPIMYAAIASNIFVLQTAFEQLKMGDQLNRLEKFGTIVGTQTGTPVQSLARSLQEATNGAVSFEEAMRQASSASAYGFDAEQLNKFGLVARRAAAVLGVDMVDALNRVIKGVSKQEIELLDELGVTIRLNDAYTNYVNQLNAANTGITYNINSLSTFQKQQAYANEVIAESTRRFGHLDDALRTTSWEQFATNADAALKRIQQAAAKYLGPIVDSINAIFYTSQASISASAARAQEETNRQIDPTNVGAVALSLSSSEEGYNKALGMYKESLEKRNKLKADLDKRMEQADFFTAGAIRSVAQGVPVSAAALGASEENKKFVAETAAMALQVERLDKEVTDSTDNLNAWKSAYQAAGATAAKANPEFQKQINLQKDMNDPDAVYDFNSATLKGLTEQQKAYNQAKKTAGDLANDIQNIAQNTNTAAKTSASLSDTIKTIESLSAGTGKNADEYVKNLNLGYNTLSEMKTASQALAGYVKLTSNETKNQLEVQQKIAEVYSQTKDKEKAQEAGRRLELQQLEEQEAALRRVLQTNQGNKALEGEITKIQLEKAKLSNQSMEAAKKTKDISDKIVGIEEQIKLLKDTTLNSDQYAMANLQLQLQIEKQRQAILAGNAQKQRDYMQSKLNEAQIERQINELNFSQAEAASKRQREQEIAMRNATGEYTSQENLLNQINNLERERVELIKNAKDANVALDTNRITDLQNQVMVLKQQLKTEQADKSRNFQNQATGLLGGTYSSTAGMSEGMKEMTNYLNNQQGYAEAISNLQSINSEATAAGQSLGNMVNALMQFSQGSIDTTTMVAAGMQTVSSFITMATSQQVSAIDAAIAAEQARDGQSEESKAKIKKLEAEKIKVQQESAKKQILIQTAVAVMQAATSVPYPWSIPLMIAAAAAGALSYAQASSGTPQLDGMSGGSGTTASLTLGKRDNSVDVSRNSSGGELSYIRGESGVGNANNFVPRAEGGNMIPGVGYITGENGIEVITPSVPSKAVPADQIGSTGKGGSAVILQVQAMDARSFVDFANENSAALRGAVEIALNENGMSLDNLSRR